MKAVLLSIIFILLLEGLLIFFIHRLDRSRHIDAVIKPLMIFRTDYLDLLWMPVVLYFTMLVAATLYTQDSDASGMTATIISFIVTIIGTLLAVRFKLKRFYLTEKGLIILNLTTNTTEEIPYERVKRIGIKKLTRNSLYFVEHNGSQINFSRNQLADEKKFRKIFKDRGIDYYIYTSGTGTYTKQD